MRFYFFSFFPHDTQWESQEKTKRIGIWKSLWVSRKKEEDEHLEK